MSSRRPELKLDWCSHEAAKFAVERWHYSRRLSKSRNAYIGVWEEGQFIGVVVFGIGSGNVTNGTRYGLADAREMAELTRVALTKHKSPVSRIVAVALRMVKKQSPGIRLVISLADPVEGHVGGIYQAGNWLYTGTSKPDVMYYSRGEWVHHRTATSRGSAKGLPSKPMPPKYRYLMPLDDEMREKLKPLAKPYPKRACESADGGTSVPTERGGSIPTRTLEVV